MDEDELHELHGLMEQAIRESVHPGPPLRAEPFVRLTHWRVVEISPQDTRHCVGWAGYEGRVTSAIQSYDPERRVATTLSGREYLLVGEKGFHPDADWVWDQWSAFNGVESWADVSQEYSGPK